MTRWVRGAVPPIAERPLGQPLNGWGKTHGVGDAHALHTHFRKFLIAMISPDVTFDARRRDALADLPAPEKLRALAADTRAHTLENLQWYLRQFRERCAANGDRCATRRADRVDAGDAIVSSLLGAEVVGGLGTAVIFLVAETGRVCVVSDDATRPAARHFVAGVDAVLPRVADLAVVLKLLARNGIGRSMTRSTRIVGGPGRDGGQPIRVTLIDDGRSNILAGPHRHVLRCIGCGACAADDAGGDDGHRFRPIPATPARALVVRLLSDRAIRGLPIVRPSALQRIKDVCPVGIDLTAVPPPSQPKITVRIRSYWRFVFGFSRPHAPAAPPPLIPEPVARLVYTDIGLPELFARTAARAGLSAELIRVDDLADRIIALFRAANVGTVWLPPSSMLERVGIPAALQAAGIRAVESTQPDAAATPCDATIAGCYAAVAETGSVVFFSQPAVDHALALPVRVVVIEPKMIVPDLFDLFDRHRDRPGELRIESGPADLRVLVLN